MQPTKDLPSGYQLESTFDLKTNRKLLIGLNVVGLVLMVIFIWFFGQAARWLRPEMGAVFSFKVERLGLLVVDLVGAVLAFGLVLVLHEGVHGFFFWLFTKTRPQFGFKGAYAYAAAPDWYFPRGKYLIVGLSPLVLISLAGVLLMPLIPLRWMWVWIAALVVNASGAVGDLAVCIWLLFQSKSILIRDFGDAIEVWRAGLLPK